MKGGFRVVEPSGKAGVDSVAFDACARGHGLRLFLPHETQSIDELVPPGMIYVQILQGQEISTKRFPYVRCVVEEGTALDRTHDGLEVEETVVMVASDSSPCSVSAQPGVVLTDKSMTTAKPKRHLLRGFQRAAGLSRPRGFSEFGDPTQSCFKGGGAICNIIAIKAISHFKSECIPGP